MDKTTLYYVAYCLLEGYVSVICLKSVVTQKIFFYCDWCGLAWAELPHKQAKSAEELEQHQITVYKKRFDWKHITSAEFKDNNGDDYFYTYYTGAKDIQWQELAPDGIAIPTLEELYDAGLGADIIFRDERTKQQIQLDLWEMWYVTYVAKGDLDGAMSLLNEVIEAYPKNRRAYKTRGELNAKLGNIVQSDRDMAVSDEFEQRLFSPVPLSEEEKAKRNAAIRASKASSRDRKNGLDERRIAMQEHVARRAKYLREIERQNKTRP